MTSAMWTGRRISCLALSLFALAPACDPGAASPGQGSRPSCQGECPPVLLGRVVLAGAELIALNRGERMALNPYRGLAFIEGVRVDVANPRAMTVAALPRSGPLSVDRVSGRYATADESGRTLYVYNADDTLYDAQALAGAVWSLDVDPATGRFFVVTRDENQILVYSEGTRSILISRALGNTDDGVFPMRPVFDGSTGKLFVNRLFQVEQANRYRPLVLDGSYATSTPLTGTVLAADVEGGRIFVNPEGPEATLEMRDSANYELLGSAGVNAGDVGIDPQQSRIYAKVRLGIEVRDAATGAPITRVPLPEGFWAMSVTVSPLEGRVYVAGYEGLDETPPAAKAILFVFATD
jgi:DNA-binding beta-propeller fold protein YncE